MANDWVYWVFVIGWWIVGAPALGIGIIWFACKCDEWKRRLKDKWDNRQKRDGE